ncbi:MAG: HAMP domain-containing histidine kinase [Actinomycetota bacterium]|nr:HAMP domain-containing histidine kinase [Actinomycetota bacterium]
MTDLADGAVLDLLPDPVVVVGADGRVVFCSRLAGRLLGRAAAEVVGEPAREALVLTDDAGTNWWARLRPLEGDARLRPRLPMVDLSLLTANRGLRPVTLTAARNSDEHGRLTYLVLVLRRADANERLDAARSDLVATVSHEIRSPLTSVKGFTKTMLVKWDRFTDDQKRHMLATINEDADRVTRLLGELLDVSRIDAGRLQLRRQMVDVPAVAARVAERLQAAETDSEVKVDFDEVEIPELYADPDKVAQIFTNLIENAFKYGAGPIHLSAAVADEHVVFTVSDHGGGVPEQFLTHIFTKFFRRTGERRSGTGLGLYITKGIVEAHGGRMWATSPPGNGASFHFALPQGGLELAGIEIARPVGPTAALHEDRKR